MIARCYVASAIARRTHTARQFSRELATAVPALQWRPGLPPRRSVPHVSFVGSSDLREAVAQTNISSDSTGIPRRSARPVPDGCTVKHTRPPPISSRSLATVADPTQHPWALARGDKKEDGGATESGVSTSRAPKNQMALLVRRLKAAGAERNWREMERAMETALADPDVLPLRVYNSAMKAFIKSGRWFKAADLFDEMQARGVTPDVMSYSAIMQAYGQGGKWGKCVDLMAEMEQHSLSPDALSYSVAIKACGDSGQWEKALDLLAEMPAKGVAPNAMSYNTAIMACRVSGQWKRSVDLLSEMSANSVTPDLISYNTVMKGCEECGQWETVLDLFAEMRANGPTPDASIYSLAATACSELSREAREGKRIPRLLE
ncbi:unnamed protein product [Sphacelaria rigidula]